MVGGNLEEGFTVFQFLQNQACMRVCHFLHLLHLVISYITHRIFYTIWDEMSSC